MYRSCNKVHPTQKDQMVFVQLVVFVVSIVSYKEHKF